MSTDARLIRLHPAIFALVGLGGAGILWFFLHLYVDPAPGQCHALYRSARTAADSAVVDQTVPPAGLGRTEPRNCQFEKRRSNWR